MNNMETIFSLIHLLSLGLVLTAFTDIKQKGWIILSGAFVCAFITIVEFYIGDFKAWLDLINTVLWGSIGINTIKKESNERDF